MTTPFILAIMHSTQSFTMMASCFTSYLLFLPTVLGDFFAYSIARYDDLSWVSALTREPARLLAVNGNH